LVRSTFKLLIIYFSWFPFNWSLWSPNILKHPQPTLFSQCQISTLSSFVLCSLYLQKSYNHCNSFTSFLVTVIFRVLNFNSDGHEAVYIITYDDVTQKSVSCSEVICLESCWMYLQPDFLWDLNIVIFTYVLNNIF